jgi:hypothetical protein
MVTFYVPNASGWGGTSGLGQAIRLRLKVERSYSAVNNRSTLTVTMQGYSETYGGRFDLLDNASLSLNGSWLVHGGGSGTGSLGYGVRLAGDTAWHDLVSVSTGQTLSWTATVDHAADGSATAAFSLSYAKLYCESNGYYAVFQELSASQTIDETRQFTLTISAGTGSTVTVTRGGSALANGAVLTHGDVLTVSFAAQTGYELLTHTVNGAGFASGGTHTVTGAVTAAATARRVGLVRVDTGSAIRTYRLLLDTGSAIVPARIFLDRGDRIAEAGI